MTWAVKLLQPLAGSRDESEQTLPRRISLTETLRTLKPTLSPGTASGSCSWCISTDLHSVETMEGAKETTIPGLRTPVSTRPTGTVPTPPILYTSWRGRRRASSVGRVGGTMLSMASMSVLTVFLPFLFSVVHPLYQAMLVEASIMLSP